jgi:hypothetical protein
MKRLLAAFLFIGMTSAGGFAQDAFPAWSVWKNDKTSLLVVTTVDANGKFAGSFINNAQGYKCQGVPASISGSVTGNNVTFVANFAPCANTITVWKGTLAGNQLPTDWELHYVDSQNNFQVLKDKDTFTKVY